MNYYYFTFPGKALGGEAVVRAWTLFEASKLLLSHAKEKGLEIEIRKVKASLIEIPEGNAVIHFWDGDY